MASTYNRPQLSDGTQPHNGRALDAQTADAPAEPASHRRELSHEDGATSALASTRAHPLARELYGILRDRSVEDKVLVLNALDRRFKRPDMTEKQERAFLALSEFVQREGRFPAADEWDRWRHGPEAPSLNLPSATFIRNAFGSWRAARAEFMGSTASPVDVLARRLTAHGPAFADNDVLHIVRVWAATTAGPLVQTRFVEWLRDDAAVRASGLTRVPSGIEPFRRFAKWPALLRAAGLADRIATRAPSSATTAKVRTARRGAIHDDDLLFLVRKWAATVEGGRALRRGDFLAWGESEFLAERPELDGVAGQWQHYREAFGDWPRVLRAAGLADRAPGAITIEEEVARGEAVMPAEYSAIRVETSDPEALLVFVREAGEELGPTMTAADYNRWRYKRRAEVARSGLPVPAIPHSKTPVRLFGGWPAAKVRAGVLAVEDVPAGRAGRAYPRKDLVECVASAIRAFGPDVGSAEFSRWRRAEMHQHRHDRNFRLPYIDSLRDHLGGPEREWRVVVETVLAECPGLREARPSPESLEVV